jgi:GNAT superfamily N-acetyltransferase
MMAAIELRRANLADAEELAACIDAAYAKYESRIRDMPDVSQGCAEEIANNQVWVAIQANVIVGGLFLVPENGFMKLANLAVHPDYGGKGVGGKLIALAEQTAIEQGYSEMRLNTHVAMPENLQLYNHLGWHETARSGNTVSMNKWLRSK